MYGQEQWPSRASTRRSSSLFYGDRYLACEKRKTGRVLGRAERVGTLSGTIRLDMTGVGELMPTSSRCVGESGKAGTFVRRYPARVLQVGTVEPSTVQLCVRHTPNGTQKLQQFRQLIVITRHLFLNGVQGIAGDSSEMTGTGISLRNHRSRTYRTQLLEHVPKPYLSSACRVRCSHSPARDSSSAGWRSFVRK